MTNEVIEKKEIEKSGEEEGASLVEYALLVALIAIVAITAVSFLGTTACNSFSMVASTIGAARPSTP